MRKSCTASTSAFFPSTPSVSSIAFASVVSDASAIDNTSSSAEIAPTILSRFAVDNTRPALTVRTCFDFTSSKSRSATSRLSGCVAPPSNATNSAFNVSKSSTGVSSSKYTSQNAQYNLSNCANFSHFNLRMSCSATVSAIAPFSSVSVSCTDAVSSTVSVVSVSTTSSTGFSSAGVISASSGFSISSLLMSSPVFVSSITTPFATNSATLKPDLPNANA